VEFGEIEKMEKVTFVKEYVEELGSMISGVERKKKRNRKRKRKKMMTKRVRRES
jgi:hypothetical protein